MRPRSMTPSSGDHGNHSVSRDTVSTNHDELEIPSARHQRDHCSCRDSAIERCENRLSSVPAGEIASATSFLKIVVHDDDGDLCDYRTAEFAFHSCRIRSATVRRSCRDSTRLCSRCCTESARADTRRSEVELSAVADDGDDREWIAAIPAAIGIDRHQLSGRVQLIQDDVCDDMTNIHVHASGGGSGGDGVSGGPPTLLPRRNAGGGPQPPPLPPARHRGNVAVGSTPSGTNCCCCGGEIPQQQEQQPPSMDRRAVATVSEQCPTSRGTRGGGGGERSIDHRRERRQQHQHQQQSSTATEMTTSPRNSSSMTSPTRLTSPQHPPPIPPHGSTEATDRNVDARHSPPELLPDILNSHLPPPYSTLPHTTEHSSSRRGGHVATAPVPGTTTTTTHLPPRSPPPPQRVTPVSPTIVVTAATTTTTTSALPPPPPPPPLPSPRRSSSRDVERFASLPAVRPPLSARRHRSNRPPRGTHYTPEDEPKNCCGVAVTQTVSIRWFIVMIAFVGLCCAVVGTVLGALKATGREHLTVSLLMIGVGIVLITVSGIAWRLTSHDAPSCRMMLGLHSEEPEPNRRFVPRVPPSYGRPHHPYAAMMYPEFQYRPPPPSYQASMQEYRLRLLLLDRHQPAPNISHSPVSPPPTYRSNVGINGDTLARPPITFARESDYSRPPSYRSRASSVNPNPGTASETNFHPAGTYTTGTMTMERPPQPSTTTTTTPTSCAVHHSRDPSLSLSLLSHESLFEMAAAPTIGSGNNGDHRTNSATTVNTCSRTTSDVPTVTRCPTVTNVSTNSTSALRLESTGDARQSRTMRGNVDNRFGMHDGGGGGGGDCRRDCQDFEAASAAAKTNIKRPHDCNVVTIVQTTNSSRVVAHDGKEQGATASTVGVEVHRMQPGELEVLAHL